MLFRSRELAGALKICIGRKPKKKELKETEEQLAEDQSFLADLTAMCKEKTALYEDRKAVRAGEEAAIAQAVSVLNSDDAFDTFGKVTATAGAFVQLRSQSKQMTPRQSVMKMLLLAAKDSKSLKLAKIAVALHASPHRAASLALAAAGIGAAHDPSRVHEQGFRVDLLSVPPALPPAEDRKSVV